MPPAHEGSPFNQVEIDLLRQWILAGAPHPKDEKPEADPRNHWAFQPITRPIVPTFERRDWVRNPIDAFVAKQHEQRGLTPLPEASRAILLRRLSLDLIGLPPTLEELQRVQTDTSEHWYESEVNRLLSSPRHGERWARHWMDIWRYSDWWGLGSQLRNSQKHLWHWRDWIMESLNANISYDEMVRQMIAADELYPNDLKKLRATGYLARNYFLFNRHQWMDETVEHVSKGFLGLTMNCVRCHDHKYDPFPQRAYYQMRAFFEPYHARLEVVPGENDLEKNGIPRVFDAHPETPTYRFVRGDEKNPDQSQSITPGVPNLIAPEMPEIKTVDLPLEAWQPERRAWVTETFLTAARQKLDVAENALNVANEKLKVAKAASKKPAAKTAQSPPAGKVPEPIVVDTFDKLDEKRWQFFGGKWQHSAKRLEQKLDGPTRAVIRLQADVPQDFEATIRFTIMGGSKWRSIGLGFDAAAHPDKDTNSTYHEQFLYVSGAQGEAKIQAAANVAGKWSYPPAPAMRRLPISLNREYTLNVRIRDRLLNVTLNGEVVLTCTTPAARQNGAMQISTFDALVAIHEFRLAPLDPSIKLQHL
ncbi:MAG: DUF1549 domain-containing protein [Zavarzinella sp.]